MEQILKLNDGYKIVSNSKDAFIIYHNDEIVTCISIGELYKMKWI